MRRIIRAILGALRTQTIVVERVEIVIRGDDPTRIAKIVHKALTDAAKPS